MRPSIPVVEFAHAKVLLVAEYSPTEQVYSLNKQESSECDASAMTPAACRAVDTTDGSQQRSLANVPLLITELAEDPLCQKTPLGQNTPLLLDGRDSLVSDHIDTGFRYEP
jgi:hypothetical protein